MKRMNKSELYTQERDKTPAEFVEHRVADKRVLRLIRKILRAGVSEDGKWSKTVVGTPQGAVISPLLANIYLHYALDLWVNRWRSRHARGEVYVVRYADDFVLGFQYQLDAKRFQAALQKRMQKQIKKWIPPARVLHSYPNQRFCV